MNISVTEKTYYYINEKKYYYERNIMTDNSDSYPFEWLDRQLHPMDPRLSDVLEGHEPTALDRLMVTELVYLYVKGDPQFSPLFCAMAATWYEQLRWTMVMLALLEQLRVTAVGARGEELTVKRFTEDFLTTRDDVIGEAS
jgi:hypothetical protein